MRRSIGLATLLVAAAVAVPAAAIPSAMPIKYTISGVFTGSLGDDAFTDTSLTFTGIGNTGDYVDTGAYTLVPVTLTVTNPFGAGKLAVTQREAFGVINDPGRVFFDNIDDFDNTLYHFPVVVDSAAFTSYSGRSFVTATAADFTFATPFATGSGEMALTAGTDASFTAAAVPEPALWALMVAGFGLVGAGQRRRRTEVVVA